MLVERRLQVTKKKTASGLSMKTLEGTISYADQENVDRKVSVDPSPLLLVHLRITFAAPSLTSINPH